MKSLFKIFLGAGLAFTMASCGSVNDPYYGNNGGYGTNGRVYRSADGTVYRQGEIYRDRNGDVYQNGRIIRRGDYGYGTAYPNRTNLPPGQAKKVYGGRAKDYAPGQVKKRNGYYRDYEDRDRDYREHRDYKAKKNKGKGKWD